MNARASSSTTARSRRLRRWSAGGTGGRFDPRLTAATFRQEMWSLSGTMDSDRDGAVKTAAVDNPDHGGAAQPCERCRRGPLGGGPGGRNLRPPRILRTPPPPPPPPPAV